MLRRRARVLLACAALILVLGGGWLWFRDSSLVSVDRVHVTGATGPDAAQINRALTAAGRTMTTLDVRVSALQAAVAPFPVVKQLKVSVGFPHTIRIHVIEEVPVGEAQFGGETVAVAADGRLLRDAIAGSSLPVIPLRAAPGGGRLTDGEALRGLAVLAAAPPPLLAHIAQVSTIARHGLVAQLRAGPAIYFGDLTDLQAKWTAASAVLADQRSAGASYIDVTDPQRPAAGPGTATGSSVATATGTGGYTSGETVATGASTSESAAATGGSTSGSGAPASGAAVGSTSGSVAGATVGSTPGSAGSTPGAAAGSTSGSAATATGAAVGSTSGSDAPAAGAAVSSTPGSAGSTPGASAGSTSGSTAGASAPTSATSGTATGGG